jgi:hypothetical protein
VRSVLIRRKLRALGDGRAVRLVDVREGARLPERSQGWFAKGCGENTHAVPGARPARVGTLIARERVDEHTLVSERVRRARALARHVARCRDGAVGLVRVLERARLVVARARAMRVYALVALQRVSAKDETIKKRRDVRGRR